MKRITSLLFLLILSMCFSACSGENGISTLVITTPPVNATVLNRKCFTTESGILCVNNDSGALMYYDFATKGMFPLCEKSGCTHAPGLSTCDAIFSSIPQCAFFYGNEVYVLTQKYDKDDTRTQLESAEKTGKYHRINGDIFGEVPTDVMLDDRYIIYAVRESDSGGDEEHFINHINRMELTTGEETHNLLDKVGYNSSIYLIGMENGKLYYGFMGYDQPMSSLSEAEALQNKGYFHEVYCNDFNTGSETQIMSAEVATSINEIYLLNNCLYYIDFSKSTSEGPLYQMNLENGEITQLMESGARWLTPADQKIFISTRDYNGELELFSYYDPAENRIVPFHDNIPGEIIGESSDKFVLETKESISVINKTDFYNENMVKDIVVEYTAVS